MLINPQKITNDLKNSQSGEILPNLVPLFESNPSNTVNFQLVLEIYSFICIGDWILTSLLVYIPSFSDWLSVASSAFEQDSSIVREALGTVARFDVARHVNQSEWIISELSRFFQKWFNHGRLFFFILDFSLELTLKFCRWLDLNCRPLKSEATAEPTEPQTQSQSI